MEWSEIHNCSHRIENKLLSLIRKKLIRANCHAKYGDLSRASFRELACIPIPPSECLMCRDYCYAVRSPQMVSFCFAAFSFHLAFCSSWAQTQGGISGCLQNPSQWWIHHSVARELMDLSNWKGCCSIDSASPSAVFPICLLKEAAVKRKRKIGRCLSTEGAPDVFLLACS